MAQRSDELFREFNRVVNMTARQIRAWHKDPLSRIASLPHIRAELPLLARMKEMPLTQWTPAMWDKAMRTVNFVKRHEAQMRVQGQRYRSGRYHYTPKRVVTLLNWGRITPGVKLDF